MVEVGKKYKTVGGWEALIIYISDLKGFFWAIHAPGTINESLPIVHKNDGTASSAFSINEPPRYNKLLPSDILIDQEIK